MEDKRTLFDTHVQETLSAFRRTRDAQDLEALRTGIRDLTVWLDKLGAQEAKVINLKISLRARIKETLRALFDEPKRVFFELMAYALVIATESLFLCVWACALFAVTYVLGRMEPLIEPKAPWAPRMFQYVEIGFALFILSKLFIVRAGVIEEALRRLRHITSDWWSRQRAGPG
jgi:hypothetical protein